MLKYYILIILLFNCFKVLSQPTASCTLHFDKSFYVTGEVIWFKIYLPQETDNHAFTIRATLLDQNGKTADYFFLQTEGKTYAHGYYKIPFNWASGVYQLIFTAQEQSTNRIIALAKAAVPVYNDLEKPDVIGVNLFTNSVKKESTTNNLQINIHLDQSAYHRREPVQATIEVKDANGTPVQANLSVAVTDWVLAGDSTEQQPGIQTNFFTTDAAFENHIFLKMSQLRDTGQLQQQKLLGIYTAQDWRMDYASANPDGIFFVKMPPFYHRKTLQILGYPNPAISVVPHDPLPHPEPSPPLVYTPGILQYLELSRQRKKIFHYYNTLESNLKFIEVESPQKTLVPDRILQTSGYESFEDMSTFLREVVTALRFKFDKKQKRYAARMYNPGTQDYYTGDPLFIIDDKATRNADFIARLKMDQIEAIQLYYTFDKLYNNFQIMGSSGVVHIITKSGIALPPEIAPNVFKINGLQLPSQFQVFEPAQANQTTYQPFFRPQLYWNPDIATDIQGKAAIQFTQSDDCSTFRIQVVAQTQDGSIGQSSIIYTVKL
jgi:hypothetical protein